MLEDLTYHRTERDPEENRESTPPEGEQLEWHGVFVAEAYGPSHVSGLLAAIEQLGWNQSPRLRAGDSTLGEWVVASRSRSSGAAYWPINLLSSDPHPFAGSGVYTAPLPTGVDHARGIVLSPTPALTLVVLLFVFDDALATGVEAVLRRHYQTEQEALDSGWQIHTPANRKQDALAEERRRLRARGAEFFRSHLPGAFSLDLGEELPTCEAMTTRDLEPFGERSRDDGPGSWRSYPSMLGLDDPGEAWRSQQLPGFGLQLPGGVSRSPALVLAGRHEEVFAPIDSSYGGRGRERLAAYLHMRLEGLVALWASYRLLSGYQALLGSARDLGQSQADRPTQALRRLSRVRDELRVGAADARTLAEELEGSVDEDDRSPWTRVLEEDFEPVEPRRWRKDSLIETMFASLSDEAAAVQRTERRVRDGLAVDSAVVGAAANLRLQRSLSWLTWLLVAIGFATLALVAFQVWDQVT